MKSGGEISPEEKLLINKEFRAVFNELAYRCFSDEELYQILKYAKKYGKTEMYFLYLSLNSNINTFQNDLNIFLKDKNNCPVPRPNSLSL